jgi:signal transduction histidine kinase
VAKRKGIRHRLLTILLLGVLVSGLSLAALVHLLSTTTRQRAERARESVMEELARLSEDPRLLSEPPAAAIVGMRGGVFDGAKSPEGLPRAWASPLGDVVRKSRGTSGVGEEVTIEDSTLVIGERPVAGGAYAWAGFLVRPLPSLRTWQWIVTLLALATGVLVATTVYSIVTVQRGASSLRAAIESLAHDLGAPVPRPTVQELASVAEGVERLAVALARARGEEERLQRELGKQERLAALGRVAAGLAHEVRNPLASIKLRLDLAAGEAGLPETVQKAIAHATSEIARLDRLVADLLVVAGRAAGPRKRVRLGALVASRAEALAPWAASRGVAIAVRGEAELEIDPDSVARAVDNLLRNAVEASPPDQRVETVVFERGEEVVVAVSDRGEGVSGEHARELFEPFFTTKQDGTGLGLALSRAIARAHGGDASYARDGSATRFELTFASRRVERRPSRLDAAPSASAGART